MRSTSHTQAEGKRGTGLARVLGTIRGSKHREEREGAMVHLCFLSRVSQLSLVAIVAELCFSATKWTESLPSTYKTRVVEGLSRPIDRGANGEAPDVYRCAFRGLAEELGLRESEQKLMPLSVNCSSHQSAAT